MCKTIQLIAISMFIIIIITTRGNNIYVIACAHIRIQACFRTITCFKYLFYDDTSVTFPPMCMAAGGGNAGLPGVELSTLPRGGKCLHILFVSLISCFTLQQNT
jgi:hypothetical protein